MNRVFADTFYYLALLSPVDDAHERAAEYTVRFAGTMVTSEWVVTELADALCGAGTRRTLISFVQNLRLDPSVRIVPASRKLAADGWDLFRRRPDKDWSLTDCISFIVMRDRGLSEALTGDHHFEQAGFKALLR